MGPDQIASAAAPRRQRPCSATRCPRHGLPDGKPQRNTKGPIEVGLSIYFLPASPQRTSECHQRGAVVIGILIYKSAKSCRTSRVPGRGTCCFHTLSHFVSR